MTEAWNQWEGHVVNGEFLLQKYLGSSEHSVVFLTEHGGSPAAIKLMPATGANAEQQLAQWRLSEDLSHPNLIRVLQRGCAKLGRDDAVFLVAEYAEENLAEIIPIRPLAEEEVRQLLDPVLDALEYLHGRGLVHGGLKPSNILAVKDQLKLSSDALRKAGEAGNGSRDRSPYDPPEKGTAASSSAGDIWSLGMALTEVLTQRLPEWNEQEHADPVLPSGAPPGISDLLQGALCRDPGRRWTIAQIRAKLHPEIVAVAASAQEPPAAPSPVPIEKKTVEEKPAAKAGAVAAATPPASAIKKPAAAPAAAALATPQKTAPLKMPKPQEPLKTAAALEAKPAANRSFLITAIVTCVIVLALLIGLGPLRRMLSGPQSAQENTVQQSAGNNDPAPSASTAPATPPPAPASVAAANRGSRDIAVVSQVLPDVPQRAQATIRGRVNVRIKVKVDGIGNVVGSEFESRGPSPYFAERAMRAAQGWKFAPSNQNAERNVVLHFEFTRRDIKAVAALR